MSDSVRRCWCDETNEFDHDDPFVDLGHGIISELQIPELVDWLDRILSRKVHR